MRSLFKQRWFIILFCILVLLALAAVLIFVIFKPAGRNTISETPSPPSETALTAEMSSGNEMSEQELYDAYSHENDPAHPMLDVKVSLQISNLGSQPGAPRPQDLALEYPQMSSQPTATPTPAPTATQAPSPSVTLNPNMPGIKPGGSLPDIALPDLYITNPEVESPQFTGDSFTLAWKYNAGRKVTYTVLLSTDKGKNFDPLKKGLTGEEYTLTFPDMPSNHCILRVSAMLDGMEYKTADTSEFALVAAPVLAPPPIENYVDPQVQYIDMPGLRISSETGLPVWFKAENHAENATKLIWQLSRVPFVGTQASFGQENGILASGEVGKTGGEFSVDLKTLCEELAKPDAERVAGMPFLPRQNIYDFYLRVVALDEGGKCIGDPGRGLGFSYGSPNIVSDLQSTSFAENSEIRIKMEMPVPYTSYKYTWESITPDVFNADLGDVSDMVLFSGSESQEASDIIQKAVRVELQVATSPYTNANTLGLAPPAGLVYSYTDTAPDISESSDSFFYMTPWFHGIEYKEFVPSKEELDAMGGIYYYVRGIFYVPDADNPSVLRPYPSETLTIAFRVNSAHKNEVKQITVKSDVPYVQFWYYTPIKWQAPDYQDYYEVARHIEAQEMTFSVRDTDGYKIPDYYTATMLYKWTVEEYQALLDERIPVGSVIHYVKAEPGFWDEFFGLLKAIYSGVSNAYANAKASVVSLVDYIPFIGDTARGYLKAAATYAIDYGLMSIGLPPTLPNIDELAEGGIDYIMKVAVDEALQAAGVPADSPAAQEITEKVREKVASELTSELEKAILAQHQNPLRAGFLRLDTGRLYQPAYVEVFVCNYSKTRTTRAGWVGVRTGNGHDVYNPRGVSIPALQPGEHYVVRIYLDHLRNKYCGYEKYFDEKYNGNYELPYKLYVSAGFDLPDVKQTAKEQGLEPAPLPYVTEFVYDHVGYSYEREFVPAEGIYISDSAPNAQDFLD
jgi:hypothetical protein